MGVAQGIRRIDIVVVVTSVVGRCGLGGGDVVLVWAVVKEDAEGFAFSL